MGAHGRQMTRGRAEAPSGRLALLPSRSRILHFDERTYRAVQTESLQLRFFRRPGCLSHFSQDGIPFRFGLENH